MKRDNKIYLQDILDACQYIQEFVKNIGFDDFESDEKTSSAVIRKLEIIGEAVKNVPDSIKQRYPAVPWKSMTRMRDKLIHAYFGVDYQIVWDTIESKIPERQNMQPPQSFDLPENLYYDPTQHLWAKKEPETGRIIIGIDALGLHAIGDLAYLALPEVGAAVKKGEAVGTLEAAKMTSELRTPVSGIVIGRNERALNDPYLVNQKPYSDGWLFSIDPTAWESEKAELVSGEAIQPWVESEINRYQQQGLFE